MGAEKRTSQSNHDVKQCSRRFTLNKFLKQNPNSGKKLDAVLLKLKATLGLSLGNASKTAAEPPWWGTRQYDFSD